MVVLVAFLALCLVRTAAYGQTKAPATEWACPSSDIRAAIDQALAETAKLKDMAGNQAYSLSVGGTMVSAKSDDFLRRRNASEILASGLASGCGDYATAFLSLMEKCGYQADFVDSVQISTASLETHDAGHAVVAVRDQVAGRWILADPTNHRVISSDWSPADKTFYGRYWIGYVGPLASYPAHDHASLREFYDRVLKSIPTSVLEDHLYRFRFVVDASLIGMNGVYLNPHLKTFLEANGKFLREAGLHPKRQVTILLVKGGDDDSLSYSETKGWVCTIGLKTACGPDLAAYMEDAVARRLDGY